MDFSSFEKYLQEHKEQFTYDAEHPINHRSISDIDIPKELKEILSEISYDYWLAFMKHYHEWYVKAVAEGNAYEST